MTMLAARFTGRVNIKTSMGVFHVGCITSASGCQHLPAGWWTKNHRKMSWPWHSESSKNTSTLIFFSVFEAIYQRIYFLGIDSTWEVHYHYNRNSSTSTLPPTSSIYSPHAYWHITPPPHYRWPRFFSMQPATWKIRNWHVLLPLNFSIDPPEPGEEGWKCRVWSTTPGRFPKQMLTPRCFKWWYIYIPRCCSVGLVYLYLLLANFIGKCR